MLQKLRYHPNVRLCPARKLDLFFENGTIYRYYSLCGREQAPTFCGRLRHGRQNRNGGNSLFKSLKRSAKGAGVPHAKATAGQATVQMPVPEHVIIPMSMHIGAPAEPVVKKGDTVMVGTLIGKAGGFVSANIHSSVSGTVQDVAPMRMVNGVMTTAVAIKTDGQQTVDPACVPPTVTD